MKMWMTGFAVCLCFLAGLVLIGCEADSAKTEGKRGSDIDYTVVLTEDCPDELKKEIDNKKINAFQMTYDDGEYTYLAVGYGEQEHGGFGIRVLGLYESGDQALCLETQLDGPDEEETVSEKPDCPYLLVKTERTEKEVFFDP